MDSHPTAQAVAALRTGHHDLSARVRDMTPEDLNAQSGASEWTIADVLSHLGSGAEITLGRLEAALGGPHPSPDSNQSIWDRWNAMPPATQATSFLASNERLVSRLESLTTEQLEQVHIDLGFLPAPVDVLTAVSLRLNEFSLHAWDVRVAFDPAATLAPEALEFLFAPLRMFIGFISRGDAVRDVDLTLSVRTTDPEQRLGLRLGDEVQVVDPPSAGPSLTMPAEAFLRLTSGRLAPEHTPAGVALDGTDLTLDDLRRVFPGF